MAKRTQKQKDFDELFAYVGNNLSQDLIFKLRYAASAVGMNPSPYLKSIIKLIPEYNQPIDVYGLARVCIIIRSHEYPPDSQLNPAEVVFIDALIAWLNTQGKRQPQPPTPKTA